MPFGRTVDCHLAPRLFFVLSQLITILNVPSGAVNPGCECVRFTSTWGKEWGSFGSPDYPLSYRRNIGCVLYSFSAPPGFILHILLENVNLPPSQPNHPHNNGCLDYLKLFIHVEEVRGTGGLLSGSGGVNEHTPWTTLLCGGASNLSFHSSSRHLVIQFHSAPTHSQWVSYSPHYFHGRYRFLNSSQFMSTGRLMTGTKCDYQFVGPEEEGRFFSPRYPSTYPYNVRCAYHFYASLHKRVRILFQEISLQPGDYSCLNKTDVIRVIDGSNPKSPIISLICNEAKDTEILSSGPHLQVEFLANSDNPGTGFRAIYQYVQVQMDNAQDYSRLSLSSDLNHGNDGLPQASTLVPQCKQVISSDAGRNGSFSSPNYPHHYTPKTECRYEFLGHGKERVRIEFTDFSLFHPSETVPLGNKGDQDQQRNNPNSLGQHSTTFSTHPFYYPSAEGKAAVDSVQSYLNRNLNEKSKTEWMKRRCFNADTLSAWSTVEGKMEKAIEFCGYDLPPPIMSSGHRLTLEFKGTSNNAQFANGFHANYAFVEDFGVKGGGKQMKDYPCGFMYNGSEVSSGTFTSPNYPGLYPRSLECHYFFSGAVGEHVVLTFTYFHIDGTWPCHEGRISDYLEFSNFMHADKSYGRMCGRRVETAPFRLISDSHFFRVSFRSNERFDGGGFFATFHFTSQPRDELIAIHDHNHIKLIVPGSRLSLRPSDDEGESGGGGTSRASFLVSAFTVVIQGRLLLDHTFCTTLFLAMTTIITVAVS